MLGWMLAPWVQVFNEAMLTDTPVTVLKQRPDVKPPRRCIMMFLTLTMLAVFVIAIDTGVTMIEKRLLVWRPVASVDAR